VVRAREPRVLAHRPEATAVHARVDATGERVGARLAQPLLQPRRHVAGLVQRLDLDPRVREPPWVVRADLRRNVAIQVLFSAPGRHRVGRIVGGLAPARPQAPPPRPSARRWPGTNRRAVPPRAGAPAPRPPGAAARP